MKQRKFVSLILLMLCVISLSQFAVKGKAELSEVRNVSFVDLDKDDCFPDSMLKIYVNGTQLSDRDILFNCSNDMSVMLYFGVYCELSSLVGMYTINMDNITEISNLTSWKEVHFKSDGSNTIQISFNGFTYTIKNPGNYVFYVPENLGGSNPHTSDFKWDINVFDMNNEFLRHEKLYLENFTKVETGLMDISVYTYYRYKFYNYLIPFRLNLFSSNGIGLDINSFQLFNDGIRILNGIGYFNLYSEFGNTQLTIFDYFNGIVYNNSLSVLDIETGLWTTTFNIFIPIYTVNIRVNSTNVGYLEIWREDLSDYLVRIPTKNIDSFQYDLLANKIYTFKYYVNEVVVEEKTYTINETRDLEFGYWSIQSTITPETEDTPINYISLIIVIGMYALIIVLASIPKRITHKRSGMVF